MHLDGIFLSKVCDVWAKIIHTSCVVKNDFMISKMTSAIWWIFTQVVESKINPLHTMF